MTRPQFWILTLLAVVLCGLSVLDVILSVDNHRVRAEISTRTRFVQESLRLEPVYKTLVGALAELATKGKDEQIRDLLEGQGITATLGDTKATKGATQ